MFKPKVKKIKIKATVGNQLRALKVKIKPALGSRGKIKISQMQSCLAESRLRLATPLIRTGTIARVPSPRRTRMTASRTSLMSSSGVSCSNKDCWTRMTTPTFVGGGWIWTLIILGKSPSASFEGAVTHTNCKTLY